MFGYSKIIYAIHTLLNETPLSIENCCRIHDYCKIQPNYIIFELFLQNVYDITGVYKTYHRICDPLIEYVIY